MMTRVMCRYECMLKVIAKLDIHSETMKFKMIKMLNENSKHFLSKIKRL